MTMSSKLNVILHNIDTTEKKNFFDESKNKMAWFLTSL